MGPAPLLRELRLRLASVQDVTGYMKGRARGEVITDPICSTLLLASAELQQLLSAFYLTLTKGANCLAKEEGSLILSCCR